eukprot:m.6230 g.6230  ORF g.6230 m.6230 type:complete len:71 (+) comp15321_c0_seq1:3-215(+)
MYCIVWIKQCLTTTTCQAIKAFQIALFILSLQYQCHLKLTLKTKNDFERKRKSGIITPLLYMWEERGRQL